MRPCMCADAGSHRRTLMCYRDQGEEMPPYRDSGEADIEITGK